jgi:anti-sigma-K factor RskA
MSCETNREVLELYALGALEADERRAVDEHLERKCPMCTGALRDARRLNVEILSSLPLVTPSPALRARVLGSVASPKRRLPVAWMALAAGLALGMVFLGVENQRRRQELASREAETRELQAQADQLGAALAFLRDPETRPASARPGSNQPRGTYYVNPRSGVMLIASNLAIPAAGRAYAMWVIPKSGAPRPAGVFRPDASGSVVHLQTGPVDLGTTQAFAITDEPEGGSAAPTTQPFLITPAAE